MRYGHVGLYAGDGVVEDCAASQARRVPLDLWLSTYGVVAEPRWGWLAFIDLGCGLSVVDRWMGHGVTGLGWPQWP